MVNPRLEVEPLTVRSGDEFTEALVTTVILSQHREMVRSGSTLRFELPFKARIGSDVQFTSDDWFYSDSCCFSIKFNRTMQIPVIGHSDRWLTELMRPLKHIRQFISSIEETVLGMKMEVYKLTTIQGLFPS